VAQRLPPVGVEWWRCKHLADEFRPDPHGDAFILGASKWNPIEHRMFSLISATWAGEPLVSYETVLKFIRTTRSEAGFRCRAAWTPSPIRRG